MALPSGTFTGTNLDVFRPEIWGVKINDFLKNKLVMGAFFTNRSEELADGGDTLHTPGLTEMAASTKTNATAVTLVAQTESDTVLTVNTWKEVSFMIEDREAAQVKKSYVIQERYAKNAAYSAAKLLDVALATLFSSFTQTVGTSTSNVVDSDIRKAIGLLEAGNVDTEECAMFFDSKVFWNQVMGLTNFTMSATAAVEGYSPINGKVGSIYGIPVYRSNNIQYVASTTGRSNFIGHPDAIHFATLNLAGGTDMGVRLQTSYQPIYLATLVTADIVYGTVKNRDAAGILFYSKE